MRNLQQYDTDADSVAVSCATELDLVKARKLGVQTILVAGHVNVGVEHTHLVDFLEVSNEFPSDHFTTECILSGARAVRSATDGMTVRPGSCYVIHPNGLAEPFSGAEPALIGFQPSAHAIHSATQGTTVPTMLAMDRFHGFDRQTLLHSDYIGLGPVRMERLLTSTDRSYALRQLGRGLPRESVRSITTAVQNALIPALELAESEHLPLYIRLPLYRWEEELAVLDGREGAVPSPDILSKFYEIHIRGLISAVRRYSGIELTLVVPMYQNESQVISAVEIANEIGSLNCGRPGVGIVVETPFSSISFGDESPRPSTICVGTNDLACAFTGRTRKELNMLSASETDVLIDRLTDYVHTELDSLLQRFEDRPKTVFCGAFGAVLSSRLMARGVAVDAVSTRPKNGIR
ncbi:hypothetical protein ACQP0C_02460 [Nocardia sp. CA-129566]|uniref:hypothetical protein n=1 Tax=Nocardia sp. CA-129566 TaxID=3239976 RepID=UPI003D990F75